MRVIGVIDIAAGIAVHARGGVRHNYQPVSVPGGLAGDVESLLSFYQQQADVVAVYVADLDAIAGTSAQLPVVERLIARGVPIWLDAGIESVDGVETTLASGVARAVVGLETLSSDTALEEIGHSRHASALIFSLDLRNGVPMSRCGRFSAMSPEAVAATAAAAGFCTVIVLDLARVGMSSGLDLTLLRRVRDAVPNADLIAGGGVRHLDDLRAASEVGCDGVLVASALLDGRIRAADVHAISRR